MKPRRLTSREACCASAWVSLMETDPMLQIGIVEDFSEDGALLQGFVENYMKEKELSAQISLFASGEELLAREKPVMDILFLDIQMPGLSGMETAHLLRDHGYRNPIVFVTNLPVFALESYSVHASGFLIKPVLPADVGKELDKAIRQLSLLPDRVLTLRHTEGIRIVPIQHILYLETYKHKLLVHLKGETFPCFGTLQKAEEEIGLPSFFRCHSSYLIHLKYVEMLEENRVRVAGEYIPVSRHRRRELGKRLLSYLEDQL